MPIHLKRSQIYAPSRPSLRSRNTCPMYTKPTKVSSALNARCVGLRQLCGKSHNNNAKTLTTIAAARRKLPSSRSERKRSNTNECHPIRVKCQERSEGDTRTLES